MIKGEKIRLDVHRILYSVYKYSRNLNSSSVKKIFNEQKKQDISFLNNVTLNSMRYHLHVLKIINKYIKKKIRDHEKILLISAITQIVFLDFKEYAVINCTVEIAKKLKIYHGFINATLKQISKDKKKLMKVKVRYHDFPSWFKNKTKFLTVSERNLFLENYYKEPNLHIVFKDTEKLKKFEKKLIKSSEISGFALNMKDIANIKSFIDGDWWVQDFSSFFPLYNLNLKKYKKLIDACAAPGGKAFQILSKKIDLILNDKNKQRIKQIKANLNRLKFDAKILNEDFTKFSYEKKFDFIMIDAPCSSIGTIRKNPEILFKTESPNFKYLNKVQEKMLERASFLLNKDGLILYMVCSFLKSETEDQINKFLESKNDFQLYKFEVSNKNIDYSKFIKNNCISTLPDNFLNNNVDGYFAACLKKIK